MKSFCNVAHPVGSTVNALPDLLREWFGASAGHPGTSFSVQFRQSPDGWWVEPATPSVAPDSERDRVRRFGRT